MSKDKEDEKIITKQYDSSKSIKIKYDDENLFNKYLKSLKTYNMCAYKDFIFKVMYELRDGINLGHKIENNIYSCDLESNKIFDFVYGKTSLIYRIENNIVYLMRIEPHIFLLEGHFRVLDTYKGIPIIGPKDRFKIDLYFSLNKK